MAESTEDKDVDALIADLQSTLNKLKAAQRKDVDDESGEDDEPKNLQQAERKALSVRRARKEDTVDK